MSSNHAGQKMVSGSGTGTITRLAVWNISHMICLEQIRVDPAAPEFARSHPKAEVIWAKQWNWYRWIILIKKWSVGREQAQLHVWPSAKKHLPHDLSRLDPAICLIRVDPAAPEFDSTDHTPESRSDLGKAMELISLNHSGQKMVSGWGTGTITRLVVCKETFPHMIRLEQIWVDPAAPEFARSHPKAEVIWAKQYVQLADVQLADLTNYPVEG